MPVRHTAWPAGTPCWIDLSTSDIPAAREFYSAVLGWEYLESGPEYGGYLIATAGGEVVAGIGGTMSPDQPTAWALYFATADVETTSKAVVDAGGAVVVAPFDVGTQGRMAIAVDPTGAAFGLWEAQDHTGIARYNEPGGLVWEEGWVPDLSRAEDFYAQVFGFSYTPLPGMDAYATFATDGSELGAIGATDGPPHWVGYFGVADVDAAVATALGLGGGLVNAATDTPFGRLAEITDAQGALLKLSSAPPA